MEVGVGSVLVVVDVLVTGGVDVVVEVAVDVVVVGGIVVVEVGVIIGGIPSVFGGGVSKMDVDVATVLDDVQMGSPFVPNVAR